MDEPKYPRIHDSLQSNKPGHAALRKGRASLSNAVYLITATTETRTPFFVHFAAACSASRCFEDSRLLRECRMLAWVLMPDHAHWLIQLGTQDRLSDLANRLKSASARHANQSLQRTGSLWAPAFHDQALREEKEMQDVARYIVANPLRAGLVKRVSDYPFWNAIWL